MAGNPVVLKIAADSAGIKRGAREATQLLDEALAHWRKKGVRISDSAFEATAGALHEHAFTMKRVAKLQTLIHIRERIQAGLIKGHDVRAFLASIDQSKIERLAKWRLRLAYRQNTASARLAGRYARQKENADTHPYWRYIAITDERVRDSHAALHGMIRKHDDPIWDSVYPPNGFNCRCDVVALDADDAKEEGGVTPKRKIDAVRKNLSSYVNPSFARPPTTNPAALGFNIQANVLARISDRESQAKFYNALVRRSSRATREAVQKEYEKFVEAAAVHAHLQTARWQAKRVIGLAHEDSRLGLSVIYDTEVKVMARSGATLDELKQIPEAITKKPVLTKTGNPAWRVGNGYALYRHNATKKGAAKWVWTKNVVV